MKIKTGQKVRIKDEKCPGVFKVVQVRKTTAALQNKEAYVHKVPLKLLEVI